MFGRRNDVISLMDSSGVKYLHNNGLTNKILGSSKYNYSDLELLKINGLKISSLNPDINEKNLFFSKNVNVEANIEFNQFIHFNIALMNSLEIYKIIIFLHVLKINN